MTIHDLIEWLGTLPKNMEVVVKFPQYWEGDTYYGSPDLEIEYEYNRVVL